MATTIFLLHVLPVGTSIPAFGRRMATFDLPGGVAVPVAASTLNQSTDFGDYSLPERARALLFILARRAADTTSGADQVQTAPLMAISVVPSRNSSRRAAVAVGDVSPAARRTRTGWRSGGVHPVTRSIGACGCDWSYLHHVSVCCEVL